MNAIWNQKTEGGLYATARMQPWLDSEYAEESKYYDFRKNPELISEVLEDFRPWKKYPAIQTFYEYLRWVNGEESIFETNDCAFKFYPNKTPKVAAGRIMIFLRYEELNVFDGISSGLTRTFIENLRREDVFFQAGMFKINRFPTGFVNCFKNLEIKPVFHQYLIESQITNIEFEAYGKNIEEAMSNLDRIFIGLINVTKAINELFKPFTELRIQINK